MAEDVIELAAQALYEHWHASMPFADQADDVRAEYLSAARTVCDALGVGESRSAVAEEIAQAIEAHRSNDQCPYDGRETLHAAIIARDHASPRAGRE